MAELNCQFVRPDRLLFEGPVANLVLVTYAGELGVWPGHAPEVVALGDGVVRIRRRPEDGGGEYDVVVSGGYAEIDSDGVIILADHARRTDDIDVEVVRARVTRRSRPWTSLSRATIAARITRRRSSGVTFCSSRRWAARVSFYLARRAHGRHSRRGWP